MDEALLYWKSQIIFVIWVIRIGCCYLGSQVGVLPFWLVKRLSFGVLGWDVVVLLMGIMCHLLGSKI